jgi:hypothetical protein
MRNFWLFSMVMFCTFFNSIAVYSQQTDSEREQTRVSKIKKVTSATTLYVGGAPSSITSKFVSEFDRRGNLVRRAGYGSAGAAPLLEYRYTYDDKNRPIESRWDSQKSTATYKYNERGLAIEASLFDTNGALTERRVFTLNDLGKVTEEFQLGRPTFGIARRSPVPSNPRACHSAPPGWRYVSLPSWALPHAIVGIAGCCACAARGHAIAAPPRRVMNSRRLK